MANVTSRALQKLESANEEIIDSIGGQLAALRREIAAISSAIRGRSSPNFAESALETVRDQGAEAARQLGRQAFIASRAARENPIPVIVGVASIALISALVFTRPDRRWRR